MARFLRLDRKKESNPPFPNARESTQRMTTALQSFAAWLNKPFQVSGYRCWVSLRYDSDSIRTPGLENHLVQIANFFIIRLCVVFNL